MTNVEQQFQVLTAEELTSTTGGDVSDKCMVAVIGFTAWGATGGPIGAAVGAMAGAIIGCR